MEVVPSLRDVGDVAGVLGAGGADEADGGQAVVHLQVPSGGGVPGCAGRRLLVQDREVAGLHARAVEPAGGGEDRRAPIGRFVVRHLQGAAGDGARAADLGGRRKGARPGLDAGEAMSRGVRGVTALLRKVPDADVTRAPDVGGRDGRRVGVVPAEGEGGVGTRDGRHSHPDERLALRIPGVDLVG